MTINKISQFGRSFQIKSIVCFMTKNGFIDQIIDILDETHYDGDALQWIVKQCKSYFIEYKASITLDAFKVKVNEVHSDILRTTIIETLKEVYQHLEAPDLEFVQDRTLDFFKNQSLKNAIVQSVDILESGEDFEKIKRLIDEAMRAGMERDIGHKYLQMIDLRYEEMARSTIETSWDVINDLTQGGLGAGELGVIVSPAGTGKSWVLAAIGAAAVKSGKTVVHYTLELNEAYVGLRYDSIFTNIANQNLKYHKEEVKEKIEDLPGKLIIKYYPTKSASVHTISAQLQRIKMLEGNVDLVIIDYADILRDVQSAKEVRHQLGNIYEDLRGLAGEFEVPTWTACFHGNTIISSPNGKFKIKDMVGKSGFPVFSYDHSKGKMVCKTVKSVYKSGENRELWRVVLDNDKEVITTPNHKFMLRNGKYRELWELEVGDSLMPFNRKMKDNRKQIYLNNGSWQPQYRMVGEWKYGEIPKYHQIHHRDMNKFNDHSDNLELLTISEHYKIHGRESKEISGKGNIAQKVAYNNKKERAIELYIDNMSWFDFRNIILNEMKYNEDNLYGLYKKLTGIKISREEYKKLYNHKIKSIEFYGYDDVYNMEVGDLHNYALDAGIVVKNSQANRSSLDEDVIEAQKIAESYTKIMTADFVMSLSRKVEDKIANTGRFHVIKNRFGPDGITFPAKVNANTGKIEIYESTSVGGKEQQQKIQNRDNLTRKMLSSRYTDLMEN